MGWKYVEGEDLPPDTADISSDPLTPQEIKKARILIRDYERSTWLWKLIRAWLVWIAATSAAVAGLSSFRDAIARLLK